MVTTSSRKSGVNYSPVPTDQSSIIKAIDKDCGTSKPDNEGRQHRGDRIRSFITEFLEETSSWKVSAFSSNEELKRSASQSTSDEITSSTLTFTDCRLTFQSGCKLGSVKAGIRARQTQTGPCQADHPFRGEKNF
ncbi:hypothetical protein ROHU_012608 [Labeo rohita]|uniref:Uncharacterized protein n=1 Tax=Labeo rohita TaxID=84645 RepID=A0A498LE18_LABRO|nr:hypothetical protein ROHU_012608 [Labeo rohita]